MMGAMDSRQNGNGGKWHFREALNGDGDVWYRGSMDTVGVLLTQDKVALPWGRMVTGSFGVCQE